MELAYLAGLFDGEGCIDVTKNGVTHSVRLGIANTNLKVLQEAQDVFGGRIQSKRVYSNRHSASFTLVWAGNKQVLPLLTKLLPYLRIKKKQAELVLTTWTSASCGKGRRLTEAVCSLRENVKLQLQMLKRS